VAFSGYTFWRALGDHEWTNVVFAGINALLGGYAILSFIGLRNSLVDIWVNVVSWLYKPQRHAPAPARRLPTDYQVSDEELSNWELVLYLGFADRRRAPRVKPPVVPADPDRPVVALPLTAPVSSSNEDS
jgi:cellulose synthase (UDP-forming)